MNCHDVVRAIMSSTPLPEDICLIIYKFYRRINSAIKLQRLTRGYLLRNFIKHRRMPEWPRLYIHIVSISDITTLLRLERYSKVREEWSHDPCAWMDIDISTLRLIEAECLTDMWGYKVQLEIF